MQDPLEPRDEERPFFFFSHAVLSAAVPQARKAVILLLLGARPFSWLIHTVTTFSILGVVMLMAIFMPDISNVFGVVGERFDFLEKLGKEGNY